MTARETLPFTEPSNPGVELYIIPTSRRSDIIPIKDILKTLRFILCRVCASLNIESNDSGITVHDALPVYLEIEHSY